MDSDEDYGDLTWEEEAIFWNTSSANMTDLLFVSPFSVLFYRTMFIVIYSVLFVVCIVGNLMVLFVTTTSARMKTRTYFFLANLAAADLCVGVLCIIPNLMRFLYPSWLLGKVMCKLHFFSENFSLCASVLLLAVIALERYIAVMHPLKSRSLFTKCRVHLMQVIIWVISAGYNVPLLVIFDTQTSEGETFCFTQHPPIINMRSYYTVNFVFWYAVPLFTICFVYILIAWTLWHSDSLFGFSSASSNDTGNGSMRSNLITTAARTNKSKIESTSSSSNNSATSNDAVSSRGRLRSIVKSTNKPTDNGNSACFCCHGYGDNVSMAGDSKSDTNSGSAYPSVFHSVNGHAHAHNGGGQDIVCWSWQNGNNTDNSNNIRQNAQFSGVGPPYRRGGTLPNPGKSYELSCLNPHCPHHSHSRQGYFLRGFYNRQQHNMRLNSAPTVDKPESPNNCKLSTHSSMSLRVLNSRRKVVRLLVMVMITFAVCVLPHHVRLLMHYWDVYPATSFEISFFPPVAFICLYLNSALNPVLYSLFSQSFRRSLKECLRKPWHRWKTYLSKREFTKYRKQQSKASLRVSRV